MSCRHRDSALTCTWMLVFVFSGTCVSPPVPPALWKELMRVYFFFNLLLLLSRFARSHRTPLAPIKGPLHLTREKSHSICHLVRPNLTHAALIWPYRSEWSCTWETFAHRCHFHTPLKWLIFMESSHACWRMAPGIIITHTLEIRWLLRHMLEMFASPAACENIFLFFICSDVSELLNAGGRMSWCLMTCFSMLEKIRTGQCVTIP